MTFDWQAGGAGDESWRGKSRQWIDHKPGETAALQTTKTWATFNGASVRRLTPTECERLQAFPDGWTIPHPTAPATPPAATPSPSASPSGSAGES
jgi:site-specific DNA-cytosine methylase